MFSALRLLVALASISRAQFTTSTDVPCPLLAPPFPKPHSLRNSQAFADSVNAFDRAVTAGLHNGTTKFGPVADMTFSVGVFGIHDTEILHQYHYTSAEVRNSSEGVHSVDMDSIYRIGSISKLLTVYTFLVREGFSRFEDPVSQYIPELALAAQNLTSPNGVLVDWNEVTVGDIASQLGGLTRDLAGNDLNLSDPIPGAPDIPTHEQSPCDHSLHDDIGTSYQPCSIPQYLEGVAKVPAAWPAAYSPTYSNTGYVLLGLILERITGLELSVLMQQSISDPLRLTSLSTYVPENKTNAVIPIDDLQSAWSKDLGALDAAGSYYASTRDMATIGRAILNSTLLSPAKTRRWLKPRTFTTSHRAIGELTAVGMPFEIYTLNTNSNVVEMYTKGGDWGAYHSLLILIPSYGVGFTILTAGVSADGAREIIAALLVEIVLPGIDEAAEQEAKDNFAGTYVLHSTGGNVTNTTLEITTDEYPGLRVSRLILEGHDQLAPPDQVAAGIHTDLRLFPNELYQGRDNRKVGFTGAANYLPRQNGKNPFLTSCTTWGAVDAPTWASLAVNDFDFDVAESGKAVSVHSKAYRWTLDRI